MLKVKLVNLFLILSSFSIAQGWFNFRLHYCRFKCTDPCEEENVKVNPNNKKAPDMTKGYYFRDFVNNIIPPDAYPLGPPNQYPQTYAGVVFDPESKGTFTTTVVDGLNYVYISVHGEVKKLYDNIQILCTMQKQKIVQVNLSLRNSGTVGKVDFVRGGVDYLDETANTQLQTILQYLTVTTKCDVKYAGYTKNIGDDMQFATFDGKPQTTKNVLYILYDMNPTYTPKDNKPESTFSHHYEYMMNPKSMIPKFHEQFNFGPCSIICTNKNLNKNAKFKHDNKAATTLDYYWKPISISKIYPEDRYAAGTEPKRKTPLYVGQGYSRGFNSLEPGKVDQNKLRFRHLMSKLSVGFNVFSTTNPDKFGWVQADSNTFKDMDKTHLVCAGKMSDGETAMYFCRDRNSADKQPGSLHVNNDTAQCLTWTYQNDKYKDVTSTSFDLLSHLEKEN